MTTSTTTYGAAAVSARERVGVPWWVVLIEGIAAIILGALLLISPLTTTIVVVQFLGIYWFIVGILDIIRIFIDRTAWGWKLFSGIIGILAGIAIIQYPLWATLLVPTTLVWVFGFFGIIIGVIGIIQAFQGAGWGAGVLGVLSILFGLFLLTNALAGALALPFVLGIFGVVGGIVAIFGAFRMRREQAAFAAAQAVSPPEAPVQAVAEAPAAVAAPFAVAGAPVAEENLAAVEAVEAPEVEAVEASEAAEAAAFAAPVVDEPQVAEETVEESTPVDPTEATKSTLALEYVEGIGPAFAQKLLAIGIANPADLLERGATPKGRLEIAEQAGISGKLILEWVNHVDLYRINGVGSEYADLLEEAGVDTVVELATRNPGNLYQKMVQVNEEKKVVRRVPVQSQVEAWVAQAKQLPRKVMY